MSVKTQIEAEKTRAWIAKFETALALAEATHDTAFLVSSQANLDRLRQARIDGLRSQLATLRAELAAYQKDGP